MHPRCKNQQPNLYEKQQGQVKTSQAEGVGVLQPTAWYLKLQPGTAALVWLSGTTVTQRATNGALPSIQLDVKSENAEHIETQTWLW